MRKPFVSNDDFRVSLQPGLDSPCLPVPENDISFSVSATNPFSIWGESHLTRVSGYRMTGKSFLTILAKVVGAVDKDLVIERLCRKVSIYSRKKRLMSEFEHIQELEATHSKDEASQLASNACVVQRYT